MSAAPLSTPLPELTRDARPDLAVNGLRIERVRPGGVDTIVSSISLSLGAGETIGIVGESGSGKSMTARALIGLLPPTVVARGEIMYGGHNLLTLPERQWRGIRGREIGLILQDPFTMLNPVMRCGRIIRESLRRDGQNRLHRRDRRFEVKHRLFEVGISEKVADLYPFQLSGGMRQRVAIAAALAPEPRVLIADEPSTALDVTTQREILALLKSVQKSRGMGLILITHDLRVAFSMCDRIYVLYAGALLEVAPAAELDAEPLHPYAHGLLLSEPPADHRLPELLAIPGSVPTPDEVAHCCTFAPRCQWARPECKERTPPLREVAPQRLSACVRLPDIRSEMANLRQRFEERTRVRPTLRPAGALVQIRDAWKLFGSGRHEVAALQGVSLDIGESESIGLVGESGSGKTTLARLLVGLETLSRGEVVIDGVDASDWTKLNRTDRRRLHSVLQIIFQDPYSSLNPMRTIGWTLSEAITLHEPAAKDIVGRVMELLLSVGLPAAYAQRKPVALSGGERQRVAIARALAVKPRILICDEPVSALDVSVQAQILNLFKALRQEHGIGYLFITHDLSIVRQIVDHVYVLFRGRVVESGPVEQVLTQARDPYTVKLLESVPRSESNWLQAGDDASAGRR